jgi:NAD(P)H-hydrate epimerase
LKGPLDSATLSRAAVRELDRRAALEFGVPSLLLMENAGRAAAFEAERLLAGCTEAAVILVGPGNNGGDGLVVARTLANRGFSLRVLYAGQPERLATAGADFRTHLELWRRQGGAVEPARELPPADLLRAFHGAPLVVDALFGTGLERPLAGFEADVIRTLAASAAPVLAVDVPSGLDADSGAELGVAVRADLTVSFVAPKPGFFRGLGPACVGRLVVAEIGIPRPLIDEALARPPPA